MNTTFIIPCYNEQDHILSTIQSCRNINVEKEIIVVDDCSTDNSREILSQVDDIKLICLEKNSGPGIARNVGVQASKYDNLLFIDGDDILCEDSIFLIKALKDFDLSYGDLILYNNHISLKKETKLILDNIINKNPLTSLIACKKKVWQEVDGYPEDRDIYEDWAFIAKAFASNFKFKHVDKTVFIYNREKEGRLNKMKKRPLFHKNKTKDHIIEFINKKQNIDNNKQ